MSETAPIKPNSTGVFDDGDIADQRRRIAFAMLEKGANDESLIKAANVSPGEARKLRREYQAKQDAKRKARRRP